jgi:hypothetical protein
VNLRDHLQLIYDANKTLTPQLVVDVAADPTHPLHSRFEWDDSVAGPKFRQVQAAELIRSVKVRYSVGTEDERDVRAFHVLPRGDATNSYVPIEEIAADELGRKVLLQQAEREWKAMRRRYAHLDEFIALVRGDVTQEGAA